VTAASWNSAEPKDMEQGTSRISGEPRLERTPRHSFWSHQVGTWLGRRAHGAGGALTERLGGPARRKVILSLGLVLALSAADASSIGAIAVQLQAGLGIGTAELGLLATASSLVGALAAIPCGLLVDKTRRVDILAASVLLWGIAEGASAFAASFAMLLLTRLLLGAVTATAVPAVASLTGDFFPAGERGRIYGYIVAGEVAGAGIGIGVSSLVSAALGWRVAFLVLAIPSLALAWALWKRLPEPARGGQSRLEPGATRIVTAEEVGPAVAGDRDHEQAREDDAVLVEVRRRGVQPDAELVVEADPQDMSLRQVVVYVLRVRTNVYIILASSLGYLFLAGLRTFAVIFARGHFGVGQATATLLLALVGTGSLLGLLTSGRLADWLLGRGRIDARIVVAGASFILAAALLIPALLTTRLVFAIPLLIAALAALSAPNPPLDAAQLDVVPAQLWGRAQGVRTALRNSLEALGPLLFGVTAGLFVPGHVRPEGGAGAEVLPGQTHGLLIAFLLTLIPLAGAGVLLLVTRRRYVVDVASAGESERRSKARAPRAA
jgi:predicted MFS family arabinose efflux permease